MKGPEYQQAETPRLIRSLELFNRCKCDRCQSECAKIRKELDKRKDQSP